MNELSNNEDNRKAKNTAGAENSQEKQSGQPELTNQQLTNKIYPTAKTDSVSRVYKNAPNINENKDNSDAENTTKVVKNGLRIVSTVIIGFVAAFVISPIILIAILWLSSSSSGSKTY